MQARRLLNKRTELVEKAKGERYVSLDEIVSRSRVPGEAGGLRTARKVGKMWNWSGWDRGAHRSGTGQLRFAMKLGESWPTGPPRHAKRTKS